MARTALTNRSIKLRHNIKTVVNEHALALSAIMGDSAAAASVSEVVTSGAVSLACPHTDLNVSGTETFTIANGTKIGQFKSLRVTTAASTPNWTLTGTFTLQGVAKTSIANSSGAVGDGTRLRWNGSAWVITDLTGSLTVS